MIFNRDIPQASRVVSSPIQKKRVNPMIWIYVLLMIVCFIAVKDSSDATTKNIFGVIAFVTILISVYLLKKGEDKATVFTLTWFFFLPGFLVVGTWLVRIGIILTTILAGIIYYIQFDMNEY